MNLNPMRLPNGTAANGTAVSSRTTSTVSSRTTSSRTTSRAGSMLVVQVLWLTVGLWPVLAIAQQVDQESRRNRIQPADLSAESFAADVSGQTYIGAMQPVTEPSIYGQGVRETQWRSPEQERDGFHLPPGFSIQLFASEPQISKPLNMAWDARGRLWITNTVEYPYPVEPDAVPRDSIKILEDTTGDGRADKITTFADGLNIPMGLLPVADGVICFSIPSIWHLRDTNGDDRVDERIELLGPFDTSRDTHGMINAMRRGSDGWIYACHGFNNQSRVTASDGSTVHLISGNTFRFRDDGSRIEQFTSGQVNPFGMTRDEYGNWYTADCHSKPLTALMHRACYPSFGRPHDGLGFAPSMMDHLHGSTAISGLQYYQGDNFPPAYRQLFYSGNVMTSRLNCNRLVWQGATATAEELPDFLTSDDPWFRPVDIQIGFDGGLYVADFYNKIIGHYEVPLTHPGRDRHSGRIWRITYNASLVTEGQESVTERQESVTERQESRNSGISSSAKRAQRSENPTLRSAEIERLVADPEVTAEDLESRLWSGRDSISDLKFVEVLGRRQQLTSSTKSRLAAANLSDRQLGWLFLMAASWSPEDRQPMLRRARLQLDDSQSPEIASDPHLELRAVELIGVAGDIQDFKSLLRMVDEHATSDPMLAHAARIATRNLLTRVLLTREDKLEAVAMELADPRTGELPETLVRVLPGVDHSLAAQLLVEQVGRFHRDHEQLIEVALQQVVKHIGSGEIPSSQVVNFLELLAMRQGVRQTAEHLGLVADAYRAQTGIIPAELKEFGSRFLNESLLPQLKDKLGDRSSLAWSEDRNRVWRYQARQLEGRPATRLRSSHTLGESYTGRLRSESFDCPSQIRFWLAGHNLPPHQSDQRQNFARLLNTRTGAPLVTAYVPRNDTAQEIVWDTSDWLGERCYFELVDGDSNDAYAWIAAGEFSIAALNSIDAAEEVADLETVLRSGAFVSGPTVYAALKALPLGRLTQARLGAQVAHGTQQFLLETLWSQAITLDRLDLIGDSVPVASASEQELAALAKELCASATLSQQQLFVQELLDSVPGLQLVAALLAEGQLSPLALQGIQVVLPESLSQDARTQLTAAIEQASALSSETKLPNVDDRLSRLDWADASLSLGKQLYEQHCAVCHQLRGTGKVIGPQLDGAVARGAQRLAEDVLNPNLNVDIAFRKSTILLEDDRIVTGLATDQAGGVVLVTAQDGQQTVYPSSQVVQRKQTDQSFMPSNFGELLNDQQLASLLRYLVADPAAAKGNSNVLHE